MSASTRRRLIPRSAAAATDSRRPGRARSPGPCRRTGRARPRCRRAPEGPRGRARAMDALGDRGEPVGAVVDRVHAGHHGEQHLRGADVAGRLLPADVLLAGLQREPVGRVAVGVDRDADQPAGQLPLRAPRGPPCSRRAGRRSRTARRTAGSMPTATSAPNSPGGAAGSARAGRRRRRPARRGACAASTASAARSRTAPLAPGYWTSTPKHVRRRAALRTDRRRPPRCPAARRGSRITAMVCGSTSASTTKTPPLALGRPGGPASSPRPRRWPRRAARRPRPAAR